jgi:transposase
VRQTRQGRGDAVAGFDLDQRSSLRFRRKRGECNQAIGTLLADKGYDGDDLRAQIIERGARPVIPNKSNRVRIHRFNKKAYRGRNVIERRFCRLKDFRRIATRYDKLARNFPGSVHLAALVAYWL